MDAKLKKEILGIMGSQKGVNSKLEAALALANLCFGLIIKPGEMMVHPSNRGGGMINAFDCHRKGSAILEAGLKVDLLSPNSICIEVSQDVKKRNRQFAANEKMCENSDGLLGSIQGQERYCTLGNSHWVMFCRALQQQAKSPQGDQLRTPPELEQLVANGWKWTVVHSVVEEEIPAFPAFCQGALNSVNSNNTCISELECMLQIAKTMKTGQSMQAAVQSDAAQKPACGKHLDDIAHFVKLFSGGDDFPLLQQLKDFCAFAMVRKTLCDFLCGQRLCVPILSIRHAFKFKDVFWHAGLKFGPSLLVGEDNMSLLSHHHFKVQGDQMLFCRIALL